MRNYLNCTYIVGALRIKSYLMLEPVTKTSASTIVNACIDMFQYLLGFNFQCMIDCKLVNTYLIIYFIFILSIIRNPFIIPTKSIDQHSEPYMYTYHETLHLTSYCWCTTTFRSSIVLFIE